MRTVSLPGVVAVLLTGCWVIGMLWASGAQMRESDQASLLMGAVELARGDAGWMGNGSYNYDKQYLSYWLVAGVLKAVGAVGPGATIEGVVRVSNLASAILFGAALLVVVASRRDWTWTRVALLVCFMGSPVVAFSGLLLSPNLVSGALVLLLVAVLGHGGRAFQPAGSGPVPGGGLECPPTVASVPATPGILGLVLILVLSFAAVAARQDAILLMPLMAVLIAPWHSWNAVLRHPASWCLGTGAVGALVVGRWIDPSPTALPAVFFSAPTFAVYMVGGLGGCLLALVLFAWHQIRARSCFGWALACAVLFPLVFYGFLLYTPRHLFAAALALAITFLLPRGVAVWREVASTRSGRVLVMGAVLVTVVPWVVGVRMSGWSQGRVVTARSTSYPTTDGFWPMGAYASFFTRLAHSCERPIDHNQEVWEAWADLDEGQVPSGKGAIISSGLISYGQFAMSWHGRDLVWNPEQAHYVLFDDRTVAKRQLGVDLADWHADDKVGALMTTGRVRVVGRGFGRNILLWTPAERPATADDALSLRAVLSQPYGGNDFRLGRWAEAEWIKERWDGHQMVLAARSREDLMGFTGLPGAASEVVECRSDYDARPWFTVEVTDEQVKGWMGDQSSPDRGIWIACGMLPKFMDVRRYGK